MRKGYYSLTVYQKAFQLALQVQKISAGFPKDETFSLTDQFRRASRSVCANIAEGYRKRRYPKHFISKISDAHTECSESLVWTDFSEAFKYITPAIHSQLVEGYEEVGRMLNHMENFPEKYAQFPA